MPERSAFSFGPRAVLPESFRRRVGELVGVSVAIEPYRDARRRVTEFIVSCARCGRPLAARKSDEEYHSTIAIGDAALEDAIATDEELAGLFASHARNYPCRCMRGD